MCSIEANQLIEQFQRKRDKSSEQELLETYYVQGCEYAKKFIKTIGYSNMLQIGEGEIESYVYLAFRKSLIKFNTKHPKMLCFRNYFFQMIKFQTYQELKTTLNTQNITNYKKLCKSVFKNESETPDTERVLMASLVNNEKLLKIQEYLESRRTDYAKIWKLRISGLDNKEIADILSIDMATLKSKSQYMRKLLVKRFPDFNIYT